MHRWYYRGLARLANRAERVIVPSSAVARDVVRFLKYPVERIRVIAEGPRKGFAPASESEVVAVRQRLGIAGAYVLMVGTSEPGKRAIDGIRAMALLKEERQELSLVLAGNAGRLEPALKREVRKLGLEGRVVFTGYVDDYQLAALYTGSVALLYLSIYEGFGLPPLEAMACATPVIAACRPAMDEVLQGAARFVTCGDSRAVADEIRAMLVGEQRMIVAERGLEHARKFSWEQAAEETAAVYREVVR